MKSRRGGASDRGGIRKRGPTRTDRDGDMDMDAGGSRAKGSRPDSSRSGAGGGRPPAPRSGGTTAGGRGSGRAGRGGRVQSRDKTMDAIQRAIASTESQATIRQNRQNDNNNRKRESVPFSVRGWKQSKVASDKDGGVGSVISFLERRLNSLTKTGPRARITKVSPTLEMAVTNFNPRHPPLPCPLVSEAGPLTERSSTLSGLFGFSSTG